MTGMALLLDPVNLVLLAIAAFAGFKLWQVLGARTGVEPNPRVSPINTKPQPTDLELKPVAPPPPAWQGVAEEGSPLAETLQAIAARAPGFSGAEFLKNSVAAHERIMEAFAAGDSPVLKTLLDENTFKIFEGEIKRRAEAGEKHEFKFVSPEKAKLLAGHISGNVASLEVAYASQVISVIKDKSGAILSGDEKRIVTLREVWTFERGLESADANWRLVDTRDDG